MIDKDKLEDWAIFKYDVDLDKRSGIQGMFEELTEMTGKDQADLVDEFMEDIKVDEIVKEDQEVKEVDVEDLLSKATSNRERHDIRNKYNK